MRVEYYVWCFDRYLTIELQDETDISKAKEIMENAYDKWMEHSEDADCTCCEEYICECLKENGINFKCIMEEMEDERI